MNILLSIDDSKHSKAAVKVALAREWPAHSNIKVVSVVEGSSASSKDSRSHPFVATAEQLTLGVEQKLKKAFKNINVSHTVLHGVAKEVILDQAADWPADLVILGSHGRRGLSRILLGSVSQTILLYGQSSTLIVRVPKDKTNGDDAESSNNVLVAVDPSPHSQTALDYVISMPWPKTTRFKLITVLPTMASKYADGISALYTRSLAMESKQAREVTKKFLNEMASKLQQKFPKDKISSAMVEGDPGDSILKEANSWPAGLIVMGSRCHGSLARFWLGSVSQEIVLQAECPVQVIK